MEELTQLKIYLWLDRQWYRKIHLRIIYRSYNMHVAAFENVHLISEFNICYKDEDVWLNVIEYILHVLQNIYYNFLLTQANQIYITISSRLKQTICLWIFNKFWQQTQQHISDFVLCLKPVPCFICWP